MSSTLVHLKIVSHRRHRSTESLVSLPFCVICFINRETTEYWIVPISQENFSRKRDFKNVFRNRDRSLFNFYFVYSFKVRFWPNETFCWDVKLIFLNIAIEKKIKRVEQSDVTDLTLRPESVIDRRSFSKTRWVTFTLVIDLQQFRLFKRKLKFSHLKKIIIQYW